MMNSKRFMIIFLSMAVLNLTPAFGTQTNQSIQSRQQTLQGMTNQANLSASDAAALRQKAQARSIMQTGQSIVSTTDEIAGKLASSNFLMNILALMPAPPIPVAAVGLLNNIVGVVGQGIQAYALRKDALADMAFGQSPDVHDINEATSVLENIDALTAMQEKLGARKAPQKDTSNLSRAKKLFASLDPSRLQNAVQKFVDRLHITSSPIKEQIKQIKEQLKKEENHFDRITNRLQSRFLNRLILGLMDALDKVSKIQEKTLDYNTYIGQLDGDLQQAKNTLSSFKAEMAPPKKKGIKGILPVAKNSKELKGKIARQEIFVNKLEARLDLFKNVSANLQYGKDELKKLKEEMSQLNQKKPASSADENTPELEKRVKILEQEVAILMQKMPH